jgi:arylformamidase
MIDITRPLTASTATWPGDTRLQLDWSLQLSSGDNVSVSRVLFSPHVGTHADAPAHYDPEGGDAESFRLSDFLGPVQVIEAVGRDAVTVELLEAAGAIGASRLLVRCLERVRPEEFVRDFPPLAPEAAEALVSAGLTLYGTDAPSVDPVDSAAMSAHRVLGRAGCPIVENLDLSGAATGTYDLLALPIRLAEAEAAPVRAVLLPPGTLRIG